MLPQQSVSLVKVVDIVRGRPCRDWFKKAVTSCTYIIVDYAVNSTWVSFLFFCSFMFIMLHIQFTTKLSNLFVPSAVHWRSGRLCPDCTKHCIKDFAGEPAHHSWPFALWKKVCPCCVFQSWQSYRSGHQWASPDQPDRSVLPLRFSVMEILHTISVWLYICKIVLFCVYFY